jgi:hypothetical protein
MQIPGSIPILLIVAVVTFVREITASVLVLDNWWGPIAVAVLGALLKFLNVHQVSGTRSIDDGSKMRRWLLG